MASHSRWFVKFRPELQYFDSKKWSHRKFVRHFCVIPVDRDLIDEFRVLRIKPKEVVEKKKKSFESLEVPPRTNKMKWDQDWTNVWPGPRTFHPAVVPLPVRQGFAKKNAPPGKFANLELMKIPNFLHLTPPAIEKHCKALEKFCTEWPESLKTDEDIEKHFPIEIISSDYCYSSPSIRDPLARIVSLRVKLSSMKFNEHAKDKFLRLVGDRYNPETDYVTITTESCPLKKQNYEYAHYLLTALYFESWKFEDWEKTKSEEDMEKYNFFQKKPYENIKKLFDYNKRNLPEDLQYFGEVVEDWFDSGDSDTTIENFKKAALKLLSLPPLES